MLPRCASRRATSRQIQAGTRRAGTSRSLSQGHRPDHQLRRSDPIAILGKDRSAVAVIAVAVEFARYDRAAMVCVPVFRRGPPKEVPVSLMHLDGIFHEKVNLVAAAETPKAPGGSGEIIGRATANRPGDREPGGGSPRRRPCSCPPPWRHAIVYAAGTRPRARRPAAPGGQSPAKQKLPENAASQNTAAHLILNDASIAWTSGKMRSSNCGRIVLITK